MTIQRGSWWDGAACADRLDLVDAAYDYPGVEHAHSRELRKLCRTCPVALRCLEWAMENPEWGIWGGTSPYERTVHGAGSARAVLKRGGGVVLGGPRPHRMTHAQSP